MKWRDKAWRMVARLGAILARFFYMLLAREEDDGVGGGRQRAGRADDETFLFLFFYIYSSTRVPLYFPLVIASDWCSSLFFLLRPFDV